MVTVGYESGSEIHATIVFHVELKNGTHCCLSCLPMMLLFLMYKDQSYASLKQYTLSMQRYWPLETNKLTILPGILSNITIKTSQTRLPN